VEAKVVAGIKAGMKSGKKANNGGWMKAGTPQEQY